MIESRFQIVFTYRCNLTCKYCDRYIDVLPWEDSDIAVNDLLFGIDMVKRSGIKVTQSRIGGGEPLVHPQFQELAKIVRKEWSRDGEARTSVATNGVADRPKGLGVKYCVSPPDEKQHHPVMISPKDLDLDPEHGIVDECRVMEKCGRLFDTFGFASCPYAGTIGRLLHIDPYFSRPVVRGMPSICEHCIHSLGTRTKNNIWKSAEIGALDFPTRTFREAMKREPMKIKRFKDRL